MTEVGPGISVQHNPDGTLDEIFAASYHFHLEQMSDTNWWIGLSRETGELFHIDLWTPRTRIHAYWRNETTTTYAEAGEFGSGIVRPPS